MSIIDRILGRTPTEGPQIHAPGKSAPATAAPHHRTAGDAAAATAPAPAATAASEGMIRVYDQFGRAVDHRARGLAPGRAAAEPAVEPRQPGRALRPGRERAQRRFRRRTCSSPRGTWPKTTRSRSAAPWCWASCCCSSRITPARARSAGTRHRPAWRECLSIGEPGARLCGGRRRRTRAGAHLARARARAQRGDRAQLADRHGAAPQGQDAVLAAYTRAAALPRQLARAAVARAICARARRSRRGDAAVRRGAGARQPGARGPADAAERRPRQSRPHRTADEADAAALRSCSSTGSPWATTCCAPTWSSACSPRRASCSSSSIRSSVRTGASSSSPGSRSSTTRRSVTAK